MMRRLALCLILSWALASALQQASAQDTKSIQDNSFLVEEAYNQEPGVVQHINNFQRLRSGDWTYSFTQEWPLAGLAHQFSYSVPVARQEDNTGVGDIALNYRYQLVGDGEATVAIAPRFTLLLPTGNEKKDLGTGGVGFQFALPASVVLHRNWVSHWNAGMTVTPSAKNAEGVKDDTVDFNLGLSFVWLVRHNFNVMLEAVWTSVQSIVGPDEKTREHSLFLNPGIRWAYNFGNGLQIVPGIAFPIGVGSSSGERGVLLYLSFEHPFSK